MIPGVSYPGTSRFCEIVEQIGKQAIATVGGDKIIAVEGGLPVALAASDKDCVTLRVCESIRCSLGSQPGSSARRHSRARVSEHVSPPFFSCRLLRMRPAATFDCLTRLDHRPEQSCDVGLARVEQREVGHWRERRRWRRRRSYRSTNRARNGPSYRSFASIHFRPAPHCRRIVVRPEPSLFGTGCLE